MEGRLDHRSRLGLCLGSHIGQNAPARRGLQTTGFFRLPPYCPNSPNCLLLSVGSLAGGRSTMSSGLARIFKEKPNFSDTHVIKKPGIEVLWWCETR
ncbi:hypothetical protein MRX96_054303 [Rhipicephalus microplus]